jgi:predicted permease
MRTGLYRLTWKHVVLSMICILLMVYMTFAGITLAWYLLGLRDGVMLAWCLLVVMPSALAPYVLAVYYRPYLWQTPTKAERRAEARSAAAMAQYALDA